MQEALQEFEVKSEKRVNGNIQNSKIVQLTA
jgi:hypothetical protein